jgi:hypothetical protein
LELAEMLGMDQDLNDGDEGENPEEEADVKRMIQVG